MSMHGSEGEQRGLGVGGFECGFEGVREGFGGEFLGWTWGPCELERPGARCLIMILYVRKRWLFVADRALCRVIIE